MGPAAPEADERRIAVRHRLAGSIGILIPAGHFVRFRELYHEIADFLRRVPEDFFHDFKITGQRVIHLFRAGQHDIHAPAELGQHIVQRVQIGAVIVRKGKRAPYRFVQFALAGDPREIDQYLLQSVPHQSSPS
jgi:hypothetical protein